MLDSDIGILLIEDDRVDIMTVQRAFRKNNVGNPLYIARTGVEALGMLKGVGHEKINPPPGLILLDLNLPRMSGIEFLEKMRSDPELRKIRIIVLTSSNEPRDREAAFKYEVDDYIVKPHSFEEFNRVIATVLAFWEND
ncbi:MAG: response regulator [Gammaproteobacteria bacterium]|nr:response regulator [Gammaproteobacteria bacterium]HXK56041.1 response regulator [Gammaproteobacteria bacterium]